MSNEPDSYRQILRRVGIVLIVVGLLDFGWMIYCIINGIGYSSSLNVFAVAAGVFLLLGSFRAVTVVRWFATLYLACAILVPVALLLIEPLDLALAYVRLNPTKMLGLIGFSAAITFFFGWILYQLSRQPVRDAFAQSDRKWRSARLPAGLGFGGMVLVVAIVVVFDNGSSAKRAEALARAQVGPGYKLHVESLHFYGGSHSVEATVTAWNKKEIREVDVSWSD